MDQTVYSQPTVVISATRYIHMLDGAPHTGVLLTMPRPCFEESVDEFVWKYGENCVTVTRVDSSWQVSYLTTGRLMGPMQCVYQAMHQHPKQAAWDVMAKVAGALHDDEEGVQTAMRVAQWMKTRPSA